MGNVIHSLFFTTGQLSWETNFVVQENNLIVIKTESDLGTHTIPLLLDHSEMDSCIKKLNQVSWVPSLNMDLINMIIAGAASYSIKRD